MATAVPGKSIDLGSVISKAMDVLGKNAPGFLGVGLILSGVPAFLMQYLMMGMIASSTDPASMGGAVILGLLLSILVMVVTAALLQGVLLRSAILHLGGRPADIGGSVNSAMGMILPIIGLSIVVGLCVMFGFLLLIVPGVILYVMFSVAIPVLVNERKGVFESISRSIELTAGSRWIIFALIVILFVLNWIIGMVFGLLGGIFTGMLGLTAGMALTTALSSAVSAAISAAVISSLYVELRTTKEGATTDGLAQVFA